MWCDFRGFRAFWFHLLHHEYLLSPGLVSERFYYSCALSVYPLQDPDELRFLQFVRVLFRGGKDILEATFKHIVQTHVQQHPALGLGLEI